jgi:hypothetical protein
MIGLDRNRSALHGYDLRGWERIGLPDRKGG